jgi:hypothetical protein
VEGVFTSTQLMGTGILSIRPEPNRRISKNQFFQKEQRHHQLQIGLRNHNKTLPVPTTSGLLIPNQGKMSPIEQ